MTMTVDDFNAPYLCIFDWMTENLNKRPSSEELGSVNLNDPVEFIRKHQVSDKQACDFWAHLISRLHYKILISKNEFFTFENMTLHYPDGVDDFRPKDKEIIDGDVFYIHPNFMGHQVRLFLISNMNPRHGFFIMEEGADEVQAVLDTISDESVRKILTYIRDNLKNSTIGKPWLDALLEKGALDTSHRKRIYEDYPHGHDARNYISMVENIRADRWAVSPISSSYLRDKFAALKAAGLMS